jgi:hypothetical protein
MAMGCIEAGLMIVLIMHTLIMLVMIGMIAFLIVVSICFAALAVGLAADPQRNCALLKCVVEFMAQAGPFRRVMLAFEDLFCGGAGAGPPPPPPPGFAIVACMLAVPVVSMQHAFAIGGPVIAPSIGHQCPHFNVSWNGSNQFRILCRCTDCGECFDNRRKGPNGYADSSDSD